MAVTMIQRGTNFRFWKSKIQNSGSVSLEQAALIMIVAAALIGTAVYFKRALQGRWRSVGDTFGYGRQFGP